MNQISRIIETTRGYFQSGTENPSQTEIAVSSREHLATKSVRKAVLAAALPVDIPALYDLEGDKSDLKQPTV
jgi:hypothetical protein